MAVCAVGEDGAASAAAVFGAFNRWMLSVSAKMAPNNGVADENDAAKYAISPVDMRRITRFLRHDVGPSTLLHNLRSLPPHDGHGPGHDSSDDSTDSTVVAALDGLAREAAAAFDRPARAISQSFVYPTAARLSLEESSRPSQVDHHR